MKNTTAPRWGNELDHETTPKKEAPCCCRHAAYVHDARANHWCRVCRQRRAAEPPHRVRHRSGGALRSPEWKRERAPPPRRRLGEFTLCATRSFLNAEGAYIRNLQPLMPKQSSLDAMPPTSTLPRGGCPIDEIFGGEDKTRRREANDLLKVRDVLTPVSVSWNVVPSELVDKLLVRFARSKSMTPFPLLSSLWTSMRALLHSDTGSL